MSHLLPTLRQAAEITVAFLLSTLITARFIQAYGGYVSQETMLLSGTIAGGKWVIQIVLGWFLLGEKRWLHTRALAVTCLVGSVVLLPFASIPGGATFFFGSLLASICAMGVTVILRLKKAGFTWRWSALWLLLLAVAVTLQLTVVFHII